MATKYKSTAAYRAADTLNKQIKAIYDVFGADSEIYQTYVNKITAVLPESATHVSKKTGVLQVTKTKGAVTAQQIKKAKQGLMDVKRAKSSIKKEIAEERLAKKGIKAPSYSQVYRESKKVSDEEMQQYLNARDYVNSRMSNGKLNYDASVTDLMKASGPKTYEELMTILMKGEEQNAETQKQAENNINTVEGNYQNGKANTDSQRAKI